MISFNCSGCGRSFVVADNLAGKKAKCNTCGGAIVVPQPPAPAAPAAARPPVRIRRLSADADQIRRTFANWPIVALREAEGDPPELYRFEYTVRSLERMDGKKPVYRDQHLVEIQLTSDYPRLSPKCRMLSPIFHPNIDEASICVGDHWTAGERLADLVVRIGEMIAYQAYNIRSPLNGEAAMWADLNAANLPTDPRNIRPADM